MLLRCTRVITCRSPRTTLLIKLASRNESCENNNTGTNASVLFKELNDMRGDLMVVNFTPLPSDAVTRVEQTSSITGTVLMWNVSGVCSGFIVYIYFVKTRN